MLKLNNGVLHYGIKTVEADGVKGFAFTRSFKDDITKDMKMMIGGVTEVSAWFQQTRKEIINDLKACNFNEWDILKAQAFMGIEPCGQ